MKGYLTSYVELFQDHPTGAPAITKVEIPLIQRDYAQGRTGADVEEIRTSFLEVLIGAISGTGPVGLDFVYGKVVRGVLYPLDGQQRLTTLFLIHWYLASAAGQLDPTAPWTRLTYETRPSARFFCESLVKHPLPADEKDPSAWIKDQPWYLHTWHHDPTIAAMLVMIGDVHRHVEGLSPALDPRVAWERLTDAESPAVSFHLLPLENMGSDEDLYIKMNSRGKPLTEFEHFKARFEQDIKHLDRADDFAHKIDGTWSDLLWPFRGADNIVDDEFVRYIDYLTEICELRDGEVKSGKLGPRARAIFGADNPRAGTHLDFLFAAFDEWRDPDHIRTIFDCFTTTQPGGAGYDPQKVVLFGSPSVNLFEQCCHQFDSQRGGNRIFTLQQSLLLYAALLHVIEETPDFARRVRVLRNLLAASAEDEVRRPNMPGLLTDVAAIIRDGDLDAVSKLSSNQVQDEKLKQEFLAAHPHLTDALFRLEDHPILRGTLSSFDLDAESFQRRAIAFEAAFADPAQWVNVTGALLATGDYQRRRPRTESWQFGTSSPDNEAVWRYLLTAAPRPDLAATRTVLGEFLDGVARSATDLPKHLVSVMESWLAEREAGRVFDWRYYLVKYPAMRGERGGHKQGKTGIYWGVDGELGYSMCMLRTVQLNGHYRDPILLQVWISSGVGEAVRNPWFTGYVSTPRWLRLERSLVGLRSVAEGFEIEAPEDQALQQKFLDLCHKHEAVSIADDRVLLAIPQYENIDSVDRVSVGADFLKQLVAAGL